MSVCRQETYYVYIVHVWIQFSQQMWGWGCEPICVLSHSRSTHCICVSCVLKRMSWWRIHHLMIRNKSHLKQSAIISGLCGKRMTCVENGYTLLVTFWERLQIEREKKISSYNEIRKHCTMHTKYAQHHHLSISLRFSVQFGFLLRPIGTLCSHHRAKQ